MAEDKQEKAKKQETITLTKHQIEELISKRVEETLQKKQPVVNVVTSKRAITETPGQNKPEVIAYLKEKVPFVAFKDNDKYKDDLVIIHNGKIWQIKRGVPVMIPRYLYYLISDGERQKATAYEQQLKLEREYMSKMRVYEG